MEGFVSCGWIQCEATGSHSITPSIVGKYATPRRLPKHIQAMDLWNVSSSMATSSLCLMQKVLR